MNRKERRAAAKQHLQSLKSSKQTLAADGTPDGLSDEVAALHRKLTDAIAEHKAGNTITAEKLYREAITLKPDFAVAHNALGAALQQQGRFMEAMQAYEKALELDPTLQIAKTNREGIFEVFRKQQGWQPEAGSSQADPLQALDLEQADELFQRANMMRNEGHLKEAASTYSRALKLDPKNAGAYLNLGLTFLDMREFEASEGMLQIAAVFSPDNPNVYNFLGSALYGLNRLDDALANFHKSLELSPNNASALNNMANTYKELGDIDEAMEAYDKACAIQERIEIPSNKLLCMHYTEKYSREEILQEHLNWNETYAKPLLSKNVVFDNIPDPTKRIRLAFTSSSFAKHPVGYMTIAAIEAIDRKQFEVIIYSYGKARDDLTARFEAAADRWVSVVGLPDETLAQMIRADEVDILVDLSGHAAGNRLLTFARRAAPIQIKWVGGLFNTTGMDAMDYLISDPVETPDGSDKWYTEDLIRLPDGYVCYAPPSYAPSVEPLPALTNGHITFGCFNNLTKVQPPVIELWSKILQEIDGSRLILKNKQMTDPNVVKRFQDKFAAHGIDADRLDFRPASPHVDLLDQYNDMDIALDPFPYTGGLTTVEALWMGVPVITKPGPTFAGRHAASHLNNVGLKDWICESDDAYLQKAKDCAHNIDRLASLREGLRVQVAGSPLCDANKFAGDLECALRNAWVRWCEEHSSQTTAD